MQKKKFPFYGWIGLLLIGIFWFLNWNLQGLRTHWGFFPLWLGYCLVVDALVYLRTNTSLIHRSVKNYFLLFLISIPSWWLFEAINLRTQNWEYLGREFFTDLEFALLSSISFSTVMPAVFGTSELAHSYFLRKEKNLSPITKISKLPFFLFISGCLFLSLVILWPAYFFPLVWISIYLILDPLCFWVKQPSLLRCIATENYQAVFSLWIGTLICGFFWEMWNFYSYPKWIYHIPFVDFGRIFEMPVLGYGGYIPFGMELFAMYHLSSYILKIKNSNYLN